MLLRIIGISAPASITGIYPPSQKTTGLPVDECIEICYGGCRPKVRRITTAQP
jgi:hypothetical protein